MSNYKLYKLLDGYHGVSGERVWDNIVKYNQSSYFWNSVEAFWSDADRHFFILKSHAANPLMLTKDEMILFSVFVAAL